MASEAGRYSEGSLRESVLEAVALFSGSRRPGNPATTLDELEWQCRERLAAWRLTQVMLALDEKIR
jgi:hypothetical protein